MEYLKRKNIWAIIENKGIVGAKMTTAFLSKIKWIELVSF